MKFEIKLRNHFKVLRYSLFICAALIIIDLFGLRLEPHIIWYGFAFYSILFVPSLYLHIEYYLENRGRTFEILKNEIILTDSLGNEIRYQHRDLAKIIVYKAASLDSGPKMSPIEFYHYACIVPKHGKDIIITCLLVPDVEEAMRYITHVPMESKKQIFASIGLNSKVK